MHIDSGHITLIKEGNSNSVEFWKEFAIIANTMRAQADTIEKIEDATNDIGDPEIQARANALKTHLLSIFNKIDNKFKEAEDIMLDLDRLQAMWWSSEEAGGNPPSFIMGNLHEAEYGMPDVSGSKNEEIQKTSSGKKQVRISKKKWHQIGKEAGWMRTSIKGFTEPSRSQSFFFPETGNASYEEVKDDVLGEVSSILSNVIKGKTVEEAKEEAEEYVREALSGDFWKWISSNIPKAMVEGEFDPIMMEEMVDEKFYYDFDKTMEDYMDIDEVVENWFYYYNYTDLS